MSLNPCSEVDAVGSLGLPMDVMSTAYSGPPLIRDIVEALHETSSGLLGIVNSDCKLLPIPGLAATLSESCCSLVLCERMDVHPEMDSVMTLPIGGFDGFFFGSPSLQLLAELEEAHDFRIGDLWWDFWFPCLFLAHDTPVRQCMVPALYHLDHARNRKPEVYLRNGELFRRELGRLLRKWPHSLLSQMIAQIGDPRSLPLGALARGIHAQLWSGFGAQPLALGPEDLWDLQKFTYSLRAKHLSSSGSAERGLGAQLRLWNRNRLDRRRSRLAKGVVDGT
jgi:hypothetical protein